MDSFPRILVLRRKGVCAGAWQLPQGGLEENEEPLEALLRELAEETALTSRDVEIARRASEWLAYELPPEYRSPKVGRGQVQAWFLCRLVGPRSAVRPDGIELDAAEWVDARTLVARAAPFRVPLYRRLVAEFGL